MLNFKVEESNLERVNPITKEKMLIPRNVYSYEDIRFKCSPEEFNKYAALVSRFDEFKGFMFENINGYANSEGFEPDKEFCQCFELLKKDELKDEEKIFIYYAFDYVCFSWCSGFDYEEVEKYLGKELANFRELFQIDGDEEE